MVLMLLLLWLSDKISQPRQLSRFVLQEKATASVAAHWG
jgi:hypothetical protein